MGVLIVKNSECEGPCLLESFLEAEGFSYRIVSALREKLPAIGDFDFAVLLGGPMNVYEEKQHPFLVDEGELLRAAIAREAPVLGICLGAQLLAKALGAKVRKNNAKEIGHHPVTLTEEGKKDAFFKGLPEAFTAFHWHGDTFDIPDGASHLAYSSICRNQAFSFNCFALALQFHLEVDKPLAQIWAKEYAGELEEEKISQAKLLAGFDVLKPEEVNLYNRIFSNFFE